MKIVELEQRTPEWYAWRKGRITASDMSAVMGKNPWKTDNDIFMEKLGLAEERPQTEAMRRGVELEPVALQLLSERVGVQFKPIVVEHDTLPIGASLDGYSHEMIPIDKHGMECDQSFAWIAEVKCTGERSHEIVKANTVPDHYMIQCQAQLLCTDADICFFANYCDGDLVVIEISPDKEMQTEIIKAATDFWERVQNLDAPDPKYVKLNSTDWMLTTFQLEEVQKELKYLQEKEDELKKILIMQSQGRNCKGGGYGVVHSIRSGGFDYAKACKDANLDLTTYKKPASAVVTVRKMN